MSRRLLKVINGPHGRTARVYRDSELASYVVAFWAQGVRCRGTDYVTDDKVAAFTVAWVYTGGTGPCPASFCSRSR